LRGVEAHPKPDRRRPWLEQRRDREIEAGRALEGGHSLNQPLQANRLAAGKAWRKPGNRLKRGKADTAEAKANQQKEMCANAAPKQGGACHGCTASEQKPCRVW